MSASYWSKDFFVSPTSRPRLRFGYPSLRHLGVVRPEAFEEPFHLQLVAHHLLVFHLLLEEEDVGGHPLARLLPLDQVRRSFRARSAAA